MTKFLTPLSILISGVIIAGAVLFSGSNFSWPEIMGYSLVKKTDSSGNSLPTQTPPAPPKMVNIELGTNPIQGTESAKVVVVEFGDYQCPYCGQFHADILSRLRKDFVNKGLIKFAFRDLAFLGQESLDAALAARCANDQGKFWAYHDKLYNNQKGENQGAFVQANLKRFAAQLGLNAVKFNTCLKERKYDVSIREDINAAHSYGVNSTPTIFVNNKLVPNWQSYEAIKAQIEADLK